VGTESSKGFVDRIRPPRFVIFSAEDLAESTQRPLRRVPPSHSALLALGQCPAITSRLEARGADRLGLPRAQKTANDDGIPQTDPLQPRAKPGGRPAVGSGHDGFDGGTGLRHLADVGRALLPTAYRRRHQGPVTALGIGGLDRHAGDRKRTFATSPARPGACVLPWWPAPDSRRCPGTRPRRGEVRR